MEEVAAPERVPANVNVEPEQMVELAPAVTTAFGLIVITIELLAAGQGPAGSLVVRVNVAVPAVLSAAEGV